MKKHLWLSAAAALSLSLPLAACNTGEQLEAPAEGSDAAALAKLASVEMETDTSFLTDEEKQVVNKLIEAANLMSEIYLRQVDAENPAKREAILASNAPDKDALLERFDTYFGSWDSLEEDKPFYGDKARPVGAGFYPTDLTKADLDAYIAAHPDEEEALLSPYTVVKRDGDRLVAVPYSEEYAEWLEPAAKLLEEAAEITTNPSLKKFLTLRAEAFRTDDYYESELAWMDLKDTPIEVAIGPYEVYTDTLYARKTAFEAFVTLRDPEESAALDVYKAKLRDMEANLPVDEKYKNFRRGFESPISVVEQIHGGGDNVPGVQTIAFNLPNDERVREAKGAKKVILANVLGAKYDRILAPMAELVLTKEDAAQVSKKYMTMETLFHELSHSLGPGTITVDGKETTVDKVMAEMSSGLEEAKADAMGAWNILYMMDEGLLPAEEKGALRRTYVVGLFRAMRFGTNEAHGKGAAMQYRILRDLGAIEWDAKAKRFHVVDEKFDEALAELVRRIVVLQGDGDYDGAVKLFEDWGAYDPEAETVTGTMGDIPIDIRPIYPENV
ncbi:dipeptidyl-peptidase 3 family protein [Sphingomicrobium nitratireducens]|uniref:dipeptidyl-peptidase 3 family protein n=1 Tax=Sphingomicrobium nitratireducens TaxID=2964666 RepID=UPI0022400498|nr:hypothetical protein [Sphingomicrobium nitratireducens]